MPTPEAWYQRAQWILDREQGLPDPSEPEIHLKGDQKWCACGGAMPHKDPVTLEVYQTVMQRDNYSCIARLLDPKVDGCKGQWGEDFSGHWEPRLYGPMGAWLTLDHVHAYSMIGKRAPSIPEHLVVVCWHHHLDGWATSNRDLERQYLSTRYPQFWASYPPS